MEGFGLGMRGRERFCQGFNQCLSIMVLVKDVFLFIF